MVTVYICVKKLCANVGGAAAAADLKKYHAVQSLVASTGTVVKATELNGPALVELLDCVVVVCETAGVHLSLMFAGQTMLFDLLSRSEATLEVLEAAAKVVLVCVSCEEARGLLTDRSCSVLVDTMMRYEASPRLLLVVLKSVALLLATNELPMLLEDVPMQCMARILRKNKMNVELCTKIAECSNRLALSRRDVILRDVLPALLEVSTASNDSTLQNDVAKLIISCCKSEQDRVTVVDLGGVDLLVARALHDTTNNELTLRSLLLFSIRPDIKRLFVEGGIIGVMVRIHATLPDLPSEKRTLIAHLTTTLLQSLIIEDEAEEFIMSTTLCDLL